MWWTSWSGKLRRLPDEDPEALQQLACLGNSRRDQRRSSQVLGTAERGPRGTVGGGAARAGRAPGGRLPVRPRPRPGGRLFADPRSERPRPTSRIGRLLARGTPRREAGGSNLRDRESAQSRRCPDHLRRGTRAARRAEPDRGQARQGLDGLRLGADLSHRRGGAAAEDCWERRHELIFALELHRAECEFLTGELAAAETRLAVLSRARREYGRSGRLSPACGSICTRPSARADRAVAVGLDYLRHLGIDWSAHPTRRGSAPRIRTDLVAARQPHDRGTHRSASDDRPGIARDARRSDQARAAGVCSPTRTCVAWSTCRAVNLSLEHGNSDGSCVPYRMAWPVSPGARFGDYQAGYRFGQLGYDLVEQRGLKRFQARTYMLFGAHVVPWTRHVRDRPRSAASRFRDSPTRAATSPLPPTARNTLNTNLLAAGDPLAEVQREAEQRPRVCADRCGSVWSSTSSPRSSGSSGRSAA